MFGLIISTDRQKYDVLEKNRGIYFWALRSKFFFYW